MYKVTVKSSFIFTPLSQFSSKSNTLKLSFKLIGFMHVLTHFYMKKKKCFVVISWIKYFNSRLTKPNGFGGYTSSLSYNVIVLIIISWVLHQVWSIILCCLLLQWLMVITGDCWTLVSTGWRPAQRATSPPLAPARSCTTTTPPSVTSASPRCPSRG